MLDYKVVKKENSIEELFCKVLDSKPKKRTLTENESMVLMSCLESEDTGRTTEVMIKPMLKEIEGMSLPFRILKKRIEHYNSQEPRVKLELTTEFELMMSIILKTPGEAVMYFYFLLYKKKGGIKKFDMQAFSKELFPWGLIEDKDLRETWESQKVKVPVGKGGSYNLLDYIEAGQSLV